MEKLNLSKVVLMVFVALCVCITSHPVAAADFDGSKPLLCAVIEFLECAPGEGCQRGLPQSVNIPRFLKINFKEKTISGKRPSGELVTTSIEHMVQIDGKLILQGVQNGKAWRPVPVRTAGILLCGFKGFHRRPARVQPDGIVARHLGQD